MRKRSSAYDNALIRNLSIDGEKIYLMKTRPFYYLGNDRALTELSTGHPFFVNTRDVWITTWIVRGGKWETFVDNVLCGITRPGDNVIDIGANMGYYSVKLANIVGPTGSLTAFEPNPELYDVLRDNIDINGFTSMANVHGFALGDAEGLTTLNFEHRNMGGGSLVEEQATADQTSHVVRVARGDDVIDSTIVFDVMKFDVEGYEPLAIAGLTDTISRSPQCAIVVEVYPPAWKRFGAFSEILDRFVQGHRLGYVIANDGLLDPVDLRDENRIAELGAIEQSMYLLLLPPQHWAANFVASKCRDRKRNRAWDVVSKTARRVLSIQKPS